MNDTNKPIIIWLLSGCFLIFIMVVIGGITRLTHSGLSMVNWNLFIDVVPPLNHQQWQETFDLYKQYPEYQIHNYNFTLAKFKSIFFWEYLHRLIGRLLGLVFIIPFIYFLLKRKLNKMLILQTSTLLIIGAGQGVIGWWMVKSGLVDNPDVSHYRLAVHLITAFLTYAYAFWIVLSLNYRKQNMRDRFFYNLSFALLLAIIIQIIYGAFVAGLNAGFIFNTWPKMNGEWIHSSVYSMTPMWLNFIEGMGGVQFVHRILAIVIFGLILFMWGKGRFLQFSGKQSRILSLLIIVAIVQTLLGIFTLLSSVTIWLALLHQTGAFILLSATVYSLFIFSGKRRIN